MKLSALLYLAVSARLVLAAPLAQSLEEIVESLPADDSNTQLGPDVGTAPPAPVAPASQVVDDAVTQIADTAPTKRGLEKRILVTLPAGYFYAFKDLNGATEHSSYMTYTIIPPTTSNLAKACTNFCDINPGCTFANLYKEKSGPSAADEVIKCSIYSLPSGAAQATNVGQLRDGYQVTISDSYGFSKTFVPYVPGWNFESLTGAIEGKRATPNSPDPYMGYAAIERSNPSFCAAACDEKTRFDSKYVVTNGTYKACNFFNFYVLLKNGVPYKTICSFYLIPFDNSFATNHGYTSGRNVYTIGNSWGLTKQNLVGVDGIVTV